MNRATSRALLCLLASSFASASFGTPLPTIDSKEALSRPGPIERGEPSDAAKLVGTAAPALPELRWLDGQPRTLQSLAGHVVLIRSFTNECPYCAATMPTLQRLHERYRDRGVIVLGVYHPKPPSPTATDGVAVLAKSLGVTFPIAVDEDWRLVHKWWRDKSNGPWTSVTWLLDASGTIRYVHPGGEYHDSGGGADHARCRSDARQLDTMIQQLLAARAPAE